MLGSGGEAGGEPSPARIAARKAVRAERALLVALGIGVAVIGLLTAIAFHTTGDFARSADLVAQTMEARTLLTDVLVSMEEGETGERGFVITGEERFLEPFNSGVEAVPAALMHLRALAAGNADEETDVAELSALVDRTVEFQRAVISARRKGAPGEAASLVATGQGKGHSDAVRSQILRMRESQRDQLQAYFERLRTRYRSTLLALGVFAFVTLGLVVAVFVSIRRDTRGRRAERKFRGLVESAPDGILIVDRGGRITLVNGRTEALFGYARGELIGQPVEILIPEHARAAHPGLRAAYHAAPRVRSMGEGAALFGQRKDGTTVPVEISLSPLDSEDGRLTCAVVRDVTERWRTELLVREARDFADSIVETVREPLLVLDAQLRVERANEAFRARFGREPGSVRRKRLAEIGGREWDHPELQRCLSDVVANGHEFHDLEIEQEWVEGEGRRTMRLSGRRIHRAGARTDQVLLAVEDVTDRKRATQFLFERESLERTNRELQAFAYVASHDLQEPLRKIQAFGDRLGKGYGASLPTEAADFIERMQNAATRMRRLIDDLLVFSRVTTRAQSYGRVDLAAVAREVVSDLEVRIEQSGGRVEIGALPTIDGDASQLHQLLQNLVANALKFHRSETPPVVAIRGRIIDAGVPLDRSPEPVCKLEVEDNGIGFEEKYLDRIFTIFQRLHGKNAFEGTGLGLAICRKIVERHHGHITARSVVGSGSTFVVTLPARQAEDLGEETTHGGPEDGYHVADGG
jgi:two-component system sensor kinase FixL